MKNPNITGIIHSIIRLVDCCLGSAEGMVVIFCIRNIDPPTSTGIMRGEGSDLARSIQRNEESSGITWCTMGSWEYRCLARPTRLSGVDGTVWRIAW